MDITGGGGFKKLRNALRFKFNYFSSKADLLFWMLPFNIILAQFQQMALLPCVKSNESESEKVLTFLLHLYEKSKYYALIITRVAILVQAASHE